MKKMYFFTKNTPAYQYITLGMVLSCTILIEIIALPFSYSVSYNIPYKYQNIISILSSISTGYIITYFYFIIITYAEKKEKERIVISYFISLLQNIYNQNEGIKKIKEEKILAIRKNTFQDIHLSTIHCIESIKTISMYYDILYYIHEEITQTEQEITNIHNKAMAEANFDICITLIISNSERIKFMYEKIISLFSDRDELSKSIILPVWTSITASSFIKALMEYKR